VGQKQTQGKGPHLGQVLLSQLYLLANANYKPGQAGEAQRSCWGCGGSSGLLAASTSFHSVRKL